MALTQVNSEGIKDGEIVNADVNASAAIAKSKLAGLDIVNADVNNSAQISPLKIDMASCHGIGTTAHIDVKDESSVYLYEASGNGTNKVGLKAPATLAADYTITLPPDDGDNLQFLQTNGSGVTDWATVSSTPEGEAILSTTNSNEANTKFLRADGDGTCSWQTVPAATTTSGTDNFTVADGNLVIGTAGHGIDFSATSDGSGTDTSELLDDYEEGEWTPVFNTNAGVISNYQYQTGRYIRVGNLCYVSLFVQGASNSGMENGSNDLWITGLPYAPASFPNATIHDFCVLNLGGDSAYDCHYLTAEYYNDRFYVYAKAAGGNYGVAMGGNCVANTSVLHRGTFRLA